MRRGDFWFAVISHQRPNNVGRTTKRIGPATWYVGDDSREVWAYQYTGAASVIPAGKLCRARNMALEDAFNQDLTCVQVSDDMARCCYLETTADGKKLKRPLISFAEALDIVYQQLQQSSYYLGGGAPNDFIAWNYYKNPVVNNGFILGDFVVVKPNPLRFDEALLLKEDYDYTAQHFKTFGGVVRCNRVMVDFNHRINSGGAVASRSIETEQRSIEHLKKKWGAWIKDNPRSPYEVLLKLPPPGIDRLTWHEKATSPHSFKLT